jgi:hypothetical protein
MAYPTGSGSEILRRGTVHTLGTSDTAFLFNGANNTTLAQETNIVPALHIVTMLSIIFENESAGEVQFYMKSNIGGSVIYLLNTTALPTKETFVFSDKFVLIGGDKLIVNCTSGSNLDIYYTYIDQNWED